MKIRALTDTVANPLFFYVIFTGALRLLTKH